MCEPLFSISGFQIETTGELQQLMFIPSCKDLMGFRQPLFPVADPGYISLLHTCDGLVDFLRDSTGRIFSKSAWLSAGT